MHRGNHRNGLKVHAPYLPVECYVVVSLRGRERVMCELTMVGKLGIGGV
jgi:hypothetical protein